jgi:uncharacterized protein (TIGR03437 family)
MNLTSRATRQNATNQLHRLSKIGLIVVGLTALAVTAFSRWGNVAKTQAALPAIMFVTQPPFGADFITVNAVFGNHNPATSKTPRGGDLYIRYSDGSLRNLTQEAGLGVTPGQEIAVREPSVHWSGAKALVSIVIGGTTKNDYSPVYWQIYEVTGISQGQAVKFMKLPQPPDYNNVSPIYGTDDRIIFTSDRPRNGSRALYPQLDEYESQPTNTGIWSMNADGTDLKLLDHAVSGDFTPTIASDGRIVFTRWDHLQRDQQSDDGRLVGTYGAFNYASEDSAQKTASSLEIFPEPRTMPAGSYNHRHTMNFFFPWQINEDGTELETLNHIGRHELAGYFDSSHDGLPEFILPKGRRIADLFLQLKEDPTRPGYFYGTRGPEFGTHAAGQIIGLYSAESVVAENMQVDYVTDPVTAGATEDGKTPPSNHPGLFRNPTPLSNGSLIAVRSASPWYDKTTSGALSSRYDFHLVRLQPGNPYSSVAERIIPQGIVKTISYFDNSPYQTVTYSGPLWELDPVEVRARPRPVRHTNPLPEIEKQILSAELGGQDGVDKLKAFLEARNLALVVSRNVTRRADKQQDFNLKIFGSSTQTAQAGATPVEVAWMQFFQGDQIRAYDKYFRSGGRRPIAQLMHDGLLPTVANAPASSVQLGADGSMAAIVPARRALTWQMTKPNGEPVVRERYWVTFAPGEMRSCANCHGVTPNDVVLKQPAPTNPPQALRDLARWLKATYPKAGISSPATTVSAASYAGTEIAQEAIVAVFGSSMAMETQVASSLPLPSSMAGTTITIKDSTGAERFAPLFFVSPSQINYQIPSGTAPGNAIITINSGDGAIATGAVQIVPVAPSLFTADASGGGLPAAFVLRVRNGSQIIEPIASYDSAQQKFVPVSIDSGLATDQVFLVLFGTGFRNRSSLSGVSVKIGGVNAEVSYAGAQGTFAGLDQLNAKIPRALIGRGDTDIVLTVDGKTANTVRVVMR